MAGGGERVAQLHSRNQHKSLFVCFPTWKQSRPCRLGTIPAHNTAQSRTQNRGQKRAQRRAQKRAQSRAQNRAQSRAQNRAQSKAQSRTQSRTQNRAQNRTQSRAQTRAQSRAQNRAQNRAQSRAQNRAQSRAQYRAQSRTRNGTNLCSVRKCTPCCFRAARHPMEISLDLSILLVFMEGPSVQRGSGSHPRAVQTIKFLN